jgi:inactivated superfamily I helicase
MNTEEQIEAHIRNLRDKELNNLAILMKHPNAKNGNKAPLGVKATKQLESFILWLKQRGNLETAGNYLEKVMD